jgi:hypothetical protein
MAQDTDPVNTVMKFRIIGKVAIPYVGQYNLVENQHPVWHIYRSKNEIYICYSNYCFEGRLYVVSSAGNNCKNHKIFRHDSAVEPSNIRLLAYYSNTICMYVCIYIYIYIYRCNTPRCSIVSNEVTPNFSDNPSGMHFANRHREYSIEGIVYF